MLREGNTSLKDKWQACLPLTVKTVASLSSRSLPLNILTESTGIHLAPHFAPMGLGEKGDQCKYNVHAACCAVINKVLCL